MNILYAWLFFTMMAALLALDVRVALNTGVIRDGRYRWDRKKHPKLFHIVLVTKLVCAVAALSMPVYVTITGSLPFG